MRKLMSRRWQITCYFSLVATVGLFTGYLSEAVFRDLAVMILGIYATAGTIEKLKVDANVDKSN
jgi:hypothetical protein